MSLDFRIISIAIAVCCFLFAGGLFFFQSREFRRSGVVEWIVGQLLHGVYWVFLGLRGLTPDFLSIFVANVCLPVSYSYTYMAVRKFQYSPYRRDIVFLPVVATILFFLFFWAYTDNIFARSIYIPFVSGMQTGFIASILLRDASLRARRSQWFTGCMFALVAALWFIRFLELLISPGQKIIFPETSPFLMAVLIVGCGVVILLSVGALLMIYERSEEDLRRSEERYRRLFEDSVMGISEELPDGRLIRANWAYAQMYGYSSPETMLAEKIEIGQQLYANPEERKEVLRILSEKGFMEPREICMTRREGAPFFVVMTARAMRSSDGRLLSFQTTHMDITESKRAKEESRESEEYFKAIIQNSSDIILIVDKLGTITFASPSVERVLGYRPDELIGKSSLDMIVSDDKPRASADFGRALLTKEVLIPNAFRLRHKNGAEHILEGVGKNLLDNPIVAGFVMNIHDVTKRKKAEIRLARLNDCFLQFGASPDDNINRLVAVCGELMKATCALYNRLGKNLLCSVGQWQTPAGFKSEDKPNGHICYDVIQHGGEDPLLVRNLQESPYARTDPNVSLYGLQTYLGMVVKWKEAAIGSLCVVYQNDITPSSDDLQLMTIIASAIAIEEDRRWAEEAMRGAEENFRRSLDESPLGVCIVTAESETIYANRAILDIFGYGSIEEMQTTPLKKRYTPESYAEFLIRRQKRRQSDYTPGEYEIGVVGKDGEVRHLQVFRKEILWNGERLFQAIYLDITEKKRLEAQLIQAQKMEAIGTLAGGLAHDFNNLLTGIIGNASLAKIGLDPSNEIYERLERIEAIVESSANLTRQLLSFARGGKIEIKTVDIIEIIENTADVFGRTRKEVTIHKEFAKELRPVDMDRGKMEQVFLNLLVNAWQAMPGGGDIYLSAVNADLMEADVTRHSVKPGPYVKVIVTDTGVGMDEKTKARIFEPFFTTREIGRGTGLGLAMVYGIVHSHNGFINVYSERDRGTTFTIYLPASEKEILPETTSPARAMLGGTETILIVDDERMNLDVGKDSLEYLGYRVYTAANGKEALALYSEKQGEIDLVILDMIMPGISGGKTYDRMKEINSDVRIILCSGYSVDGDAQKIMDKGCNGFIQKPFTLTVLSREIRKALGES